MYEQKVKRPDRYATLEECCSVGDVNLLDTNNNCTN